jgi:oligo-1,6-glucosidase
MQWDGTKHAGFSAVKPWFRVNPNYHRINVAAEDRDPDSILNFYRRCLELRKKSETLIYGDYKEYYSMHPKLYMYERTYEGERVLVVCSFAKKNLRFSFPGVWKKAKKELLLCNYAVPEEERVSSSDSDFDIEAESMNSRTNASDTGAEIMSSADSKPDTRAERTLRPYVARVYALRAE